MARSSFSDGGCSPTPQALTNLLHSILVHQPEESKIMGSTLWTAHPFLARHVMLLTEVCPSCVKLRINGYVGPDIWEMQTSVFAVGTRIACKAESTESAFNSAPGIHQHARCIT